MFETVRAEMARKNMSIVALAQATGIRYQTLSEKLRGNFPLTLQEAVGIKSALDLNMPIEELFDCQVKK